MSRRHLTVPNPVPDIDNVIANASPSNKDPFKYSHGLTGIDQPANYLYVHILVATAIVPAIVVFLYRILTGLRDNRRRIAVINSCIHHGSWKRDRHACWGSIKRHFIYAPLFRTRQRETRTSRIFNIGKVPTRPQFLVITVYVLSNIHYCIAISIHPEMEMLAAIRGRCGALATFNLILTMLLALRNNPFVWILYISYDTFNLFHRWAARLVLVQATAHVVAFAASAYQVTYKGQSGWASVFWVLTHSISYRWGVAAFTAFVFLNIHSLRPLRLAFYDAFLALHRLGVVVAVAGIYFHLDTHALPQLPWVYLVIALLALELLSRITRIVRLNFSHRTPRWTQVTLTPLADATRVTFNVPRSWTASPGSHVHVYIPRLSLSSHPFSVAWSTTRLGTEKLPLTIEHAEQSSPPTISCIIRARAGMTRHMHDVARAQGSTTMYAAIEGPYGGGQSLASYGTVVLFAGGAGITHYLMFVRELLIRRTECTAVVRRVLVVWCVRDLQAVDWVREWLGQVARMDGFERVVRIRVYVSKGVIGAEIEVPAYVEVREGRCEVQKVVDEEVLVQVGAMVVSVCGPRDFNDSVRSAVRRRMCVRSIDFIEEAFSY